jgi:hypothetical protein
MNADRWYSHCAKYTHPPNKRIFPRRQEVKGLVLQRKGNEEKRGALQLAADDGWNSKPVWGTLQ